MCGRVHVGDWMWDSGCDVGGLINVWEGMGGGVGPEARLHGADVGRWMWVCQVLWVPQLTGLYMPCPQRNLAMIS